ncbi:MAG TPA: hypothetical protein VHV32_19120 [Candidatus Angelobacter sp.]|jgi:hypothetical protein|nr:hypothetical protein [Candidatus Angelobacter sp.]
MAGEHLGAVGAVSAVAPLIEAIMRDAARYRLLREIAYWSHHDLAWVDTYDGLCNLRREELDAKLDEILGAK